MIDWIKRKLRKRVFFAKLRVWRTESMRGKKCGVYLCENQPIEKCNLCGNYYCEEHAHTHFHIEREAQIDDTGARNEENIWRQHK